MSDRKASVWEIVGLFGIVVCYMLSIALGLLRVRRKTKRILLQTSNGGETIQGNKSILSYVNVDENPEEEIEGTWNVFKAIWSNAFNKQLFRDSTFWMRIYLIVEVSKKNQVFFKF